jgi:D-alanine-D-alanine ligase
MKVGLLSRKTKLDKKNLTAGDRIYLSDVDTTDAVMNALLESGYAVEVIKPEPVNNLLNKKIDLIFNLCDDGFYGRSQLEPHIPALLDVLSIPYTGSNYLTLALCLDKARTKQLLMYSDIPTPAFQVFTDMGDKLNPKLKFPLIVKPSREDASIGIQDDSVVYDKKKLMQKICSVISTYKQPALVEEYIRGRELNVGILGNEHPTVLPVSEIIFTLPDDMNRICSYEAKWNPSHVAYIGTKPQCPAIVSKVLLKKLVRLSLKSYEIMECRDYCRVDFRVDLKGRPYVLEVNPNPDINPNAGLANMSSKAGISYASLIRRVVEYACERNCMGKQ